MPLKDVVKVSRKTYINPKGWVGYDLIKDQTRSVWQILKGLFTPAKPERKETFKQAMQRLNVSENDLKEKEQTFLFYSYGFAILSVATFIISFFYLFQHHTIAGWLLGLAVSALLIAQAFRFNFWSFQIKHRKLGCTFEEWKRGKPANSGSSKE